MLSNLGWMLTNSGCSLASLGMSLFYKTSPKELILCCGSMEMDTLCLFPASCSPLLGTGKISTARCYMRGREGWMHAVLVSFVHEGSESAYMASRSAEADLC